MGRLLQFFDTAQVFSLTQYSLPFETLYLLSTAICLGLLATFVPPLGNRMLRLSGAYWLGTLLALVLYGVLFSFSLLVSPAFATPADMVWSAIFIMLPLNVRSWHHAIDRNLVRWSLLALVLFSLMLEFVVPMGSVHFPARVALVGLFQLMGIAWLSWELHRFDPRFRFSQLGLIQLLTLMHGAAVLLRLGYTFWLAPRPLMQDDLFMSYTLMFQGVLLLLIAMVFNNHYLEHLLNSEEENTQKIQQKEQLLQAAHERSEKLRHEQSRLLLMLEHQLRNPMSVLQLAMTDPSVAIEPAKRAARSLRDMQTLLERCVFMDKLDHQAIVLSPELCDVPDLIANISKTHPEGARVISACQEAIPLLYCDLILLNIVLTNLIDNALKYSPPKEEVKVAVSFMSHPANHLELVVSNAVGPAGAPEADKVFSKYYRSTQAQHMQGSGLGLYLVHKMVELMQASVKCESTPQEVRFVLCLKL